MSEPSTELLGRLIGRCVAAGETVEIDGLGAFVPDPAAGVRFEPVNRRRVFIAYGKEDQRQAEWLYDSLESAGFQPWMDVRQLLPGQNWPRAIEGAIETSDYFIALFSSRSVNQRGGFQAEIRYALDCARRVPLDDVFMVPVRLDLCRVPRRIENELQYIDLFPEPARGFRRLAAVLRRGSNRSGR